VPLPHDARPGGDADRRMGYAWAAGRDRDRKAAQDQRQEADRGVRHRSVQPPLPPKRIHLQGRLGGAVGPRRVLARLRARLRHLHERLHRDGVVALEAPARQGALVPGEQGAALLPALRDGAQLARAGPGLRDGPGELGLRDVPAGERPPPPARDLDHHTVDVARERGGRGASRPRVRRVRRGRRPLHHGNGAGGGRARRAPVARRRHARRGIPRPRTRGPALCPAARPGRAAAGGRARGGGRCRVRVVRRGVGAGALGAGVRRRRLPRGPAVRARAREPRRRRRHVPRHAVGRDQRQARDRQGDKPVDHRAPEARGPLAGNAAPHAHLSLLLALRLGPDLLRAHVVVRAHHGDQDPLARDQRAGGLASARGRSGRPSIAR